MLPTAMGEAEHYSESQRETTTWRPCSFTADCHHSFTCRPQVMMSHLCPKRPPAAPQLKGSCSAAPLSSSTSLYFFFQAVGLQKTSFLTDELNWKGFVVHILADVAQLFAVFVKERLVCEQIFIHKRRKMSPVSLGLKQVKLDLAEFGALMARVGEVVVRPDLILTLAAYGSNVINAKLKALTVLTSELAIFKGLLRKILRSMQIRNS